MGFRILDSLNLLYLNIFHSRVEMNNCLGSWGNKLFGLGKIQNVEPRLE